jgi:uncharacterized protein YmfQ (DUF2313 family)
VLILAGLIGTACATAPPVQEMSDARQAIASAMDADARQYAPQLLADAERLIALAETQIVEAAYGRARMSAVRAKSRALRALEEAHTVQETEP